MAQKQGLMSSSKNCNSLLRPSINEWRPKKNLFLDPFINLGGKNEAFVSKSF